MTPQEFDLMCRLIEAATAAAYLVGREDEKAGTPAKTVELKLDTGRRMLLKREINKRQKRR